jgi:hypothetical protein
VRQLLPICVLFGFIAACALPPAPSNTREAPTPTALATSGMTHPARSPSTANPADGIARYPSGIPKTFDGQPVEIGFAAVLHAQATTDATPFLVGGWFDDGSLNVCGRINLDPSPLLTGCATAVGGDSPWGAYSWPGPQGWMYWNGHRLPEGLGPSIVKVHTHDPRSSACLSGSFPPCQSIIVVDDVSWTGDTWTKADPISVAQAARRLDAFTISMNVPEGPNSSLVVERHVFMTPVAEACPSPWPHEVFALHGDPQVGLVAIFPDEGARSNAQATLDPAAPGCATDPRIIRPAAASWVGTQNILVLVYGADVGSAVQAALSSGKGWDPSFAAPFSPDGLDESYRVVNDAEASRANGTFNANYALANNAADEGYENYVKETYRRFAANALSYVIGEGRQVSQTDVGATQWAELEQDAVPGTARLYVIDHPASTDPAFATEVLVSFEGRQASSDTWYLKVVGPAPAR